MSAPPIRSWVCPQCHVELGRITGSGDLVITRAATVVECSRLAVVVRCVCGCAKAFTGRRVLIDVPAPVPNQSDRLAG